MSREATQFKPGDKPAHTWAADVAATRGKPRAMTPKQAAFFEHYMKHNSGRAAALAAGYTQKSADSRAYDLLHKPGPVVDAINATRKAVAEKTEYSLEALVKELDESAAFSRETRNATALVRSIELKAKAFGLLIERIDQRQVGGFKIQIVGIDDSVMPAASRLTASEDLDIFA